MVDLNCRRDPGEYRHLITIEDMTGSSADVHGFIDPTDAANWATHTTAWAKILTKGGREYNYRNEITSEVTHVFLVPYDSTVGAATSDMRISWNSNTYEITTVINANEADTEIELHAKRTTS